MIAIQPTIRGVVEDEWNRLARRHPFASYGWLLTIERCWRARFEPLYVTLELDGRLCAAAAAYVVEASPGVETLDDLVFGRLHGPASRMGVSFLPALTCGPAQGYGWHIGVDPDLEQPQRERLCEQILEALEAEADRRRLPLALPLTLDEQPRLRAMLARRGYLAGQSVPAGILDIPPEWTSIDDYFTHLVGKRGRNCRRERLRNLEAGVKIEPLTAGEAADRATAERLHGLMERNARSHGSPGLPFGPELSAELLANLPGATPILVARKKGRISGALITLEGGDAVAAYAVGVDAKLAGNDFTYFNLAYYEVIARAIEQGRRRVLFGRGAYDVKVRRGCRLSQSCIHLRVGAWAAALTRPWLALASAWNRSKLPHGLRRRPAEHP